MLSRDSGVAKEQMYEAIMKKIANFSGTSHPVHLKLYLHYFSPAIY